MNSHGEFLNAIRKQETGNLKNPWIRTKVKGSSSSAYGPYQTTMGLNKAYLENKKNLFTPDETVALERLVRQQELSLKIGGIDRKKFEKHFTKEQLDRFDYGGDFDISDIEKEQIESAQKKMLLDTLEETRGDMEEAAKRWHGGALHGNEKPHVNYAEEVMKRLKEDPRPPRSNIDKPIQGGKNYR